MNQLLLQLPDTTADLLGGNLGAAALTKAILYYVVLGLMSFVAVAGQVQAQSHGVKRARDSVWKKMLGMRMEYFDRNDPSDLMSAIINDSGNAVNDMVNIIVNLIPDIYYVVIALVRINQYHWILAVSCFAMLPLKYLYSFVMGRKMQAGTAKVYDEIGSLTCFLSDRINHLPLIKTYTNEEKEGKTGKNVAHKLLRGGDIILMDEPTSALDVQVSAKIQDTMDMVFAGKTRILITHDLSFAQKYQRILVMKGSRLVGDGTHETLLKTCETYRDMVEHYQLFCKTL